jgi:hypothetical protein
MTRLVILLAVELHLRPARADHRQPVVRHCPTHPPLHDPRHIERHKLPSPRDLRRLHHSPQRRQRRVGHAELRPNATHALKAHRPRHVRAIAIHPQRRPRYLRRGRPRRQQAQIELHQRGVLAAHIKIAQRPRIHRRPHAGYMRVAHQRRLLRHRCIGTAKRETQGRQRKQYL